METSEPSRLRAVTLAGSRRPASAQAHNEAWLAEIWQRQAFRKDHLETGSGLSFQVIYPGQRTGEAGPDFRDAILALPDGAILRGDVEIHLNSQGWREHGHHRDPAYDRVLLHVVLVAGEQARNSKGEAVLTLELGSRLPPDAGGSPPRLAQTVAQLSYVLAPCKRRLPERSPAQLQELLTRLALQRFAAKQAFFEGELAACEPDQVLYAGLLEALGYSRNRQAFRRLAQLAPLNAVRCSGSAAGIERLLLQASGLAHEPSAAADAGLLPLRLPSGSWQMLGVRPDNWPRRRIEQVSAILARHARDLLDDLLGPLASDGAVEAPPVRQLRAGWLDVLAELGPQRVDAFAINVLLPFAAAAGQASCQFGLSEQAVAVFQAYPAEGGNQATRYMQREILRAQASAAAGAAGEQALLHVWQQWCHDKVCALCPFGTREAGG